MHLFACNPLRQEPLCQELARLWPHATITELEPGLVACALGAITPSVKRQPAVAFATQVLPDARLVSATSVNGWAQLLAVELAAALCASQPWRLHLLASPAMATGTRRLALIEQAVGALQKKKQRQLARQQVLSAETPFVKDEALVQLAMVNPEQAYLSVALPTTRQAWRRTLSRFPAGMVTLTEDRGPPARAYLKLTEALMHLGHSPGPQDVCVDLGSSPGSWTYVALALGARVIAVDRSPLRDDLMQHPRLEFCRGDAFTFAPPTPVDWLLCDVIAYPDRIMALLDTWLTRKDCRFFVVTLKFRGTSDYACIETCKTLLNRCRARYGMRAMQFNKNEITVYGRVL